MTATVASLDLRRRTGRRLQYALVADSERCIHQQVLTSTYCIVTFCAFVSLPLRRSTRRAMVLRLGIAVYICLVYRSLYDDDG